MHVPLKLSCHLLQLADGFVVVVAVLHILVAIVVVVVVGCHFLAMLLQTRRLATLATEALLWHWTTLVAGQPLWYPTDAKQF